MKLLALKLLLFTLVAFSLPVFASMPKITQPECEAAALSKPFQKTRIDGGEDSAFIGAVVGMLDDFWREEIKKLTLQDLGITADTVQAHLGHRSEGIRIVPSRKYEDLKVVLYQGTVQTAVGPATNEMPLYSPLDKTIFISHFAFTSRLIGLLRKDSAWAYVLAHEMGHHIQNIMGYMKLVAKFTPGTPTSNAFTTRMELQADCLAGYWIGRNTNLFSSHEIDQIAKMPSTIGGADHGSGAQRDRWFHIGLYAPSISECGEVFFLKSGRL